MAFNWNFNWGDQDAEEDIFKETRMSFGDHIEVLRLHLFRAIAGFLICMVASFAIGQPLLEYIQKPVKDALVEAYNRRLDKVKKEAAKGDEGDEAINGIREIPVRISKDSLRKMGLDPKLPEDQPWLEIPLGVRPSDIGLTAIPVVQRLQPPPSMVALSITEGIMMYLKVCVYAGLVVSSPWVFYQLWSFVAAGLYPQEKKLVHVYLPISVALFLTGVVACEFVVLPKAVHYLLEFNEWLGLEPDLRLSEWLSFAIMMPVMFGVAFQTPMVMLFLRQLGIVTTQTFITKWRIAFFIAAIAAILITPSPDPFTYLSTMVPLWGLYGLGIVFCWIFPQPEFSRELEGDESEQETTVEV